MRVTSKVRYAVLAMFELASRPDEFVSVASLSERANIPQTFLEQLLLRLKRAGLTTSRRGPDGGYTLARAADRIRLSDIYVAVEGPLNLCSNDENDAATPSHPGETLWRDLEGAILDFLNAVTLEDLLTRNGQRNANPVVAHPYTFSI
jgi:Rrf2 family iron-sulfur cluster assembly transcriptional regulator